MKSHATSEIRNLAVVGHGHCGKTSLVEALLFAAGQVQRLGRTDQGTATTDYSEDEQEHHHSVRLALAHLPAGDRKLNLIDTPGFGNFIYDAYVGLSVAETALVVLDAQAGVEVQTDRVWKYAAELEVPARVIVLNKMDRENVEFDRALQAVQDRFGRTAVPLQVPIGAGPDFRGVVDLVSAKSHVRKAEGSAECEVGDPPPELADLVAARREELIEMVAESDEALMETFLEAGELSPEQLVSGLRRAIAGGDLQPIVLASATNLAGIGPLAATLADLAPAPTARPGRAGKDGETRREAADDQPVSLQVFKTLVDPFAGRLSLFRLYSGTLGGDAVLRNVGRGADERCSSPLALVGKEQHKLADMHAGDIGCFLKLKETLTGDTLADKASPIEYEPLPVPDAPMSFAIEPKNQGDEEKIGNALSRIAEEDLMLRYQFDPETKELVVSGAGDQHIRGVVELLAKRYKVQVVLHPPRVPYRETIRSKASGSYRHKKQTGGAGQFAEVHMEILPLQRGGGFEYDTGRIFGGSISQNFFPSIEKGLRQVLDRGPLAGYPVVDVRCEVFDGKMHPVDSKDIAFQIAGRQLMRQLLLQARPVLLEPIMQVTVTVPEEAMGDVMGDLSGRRGKVLGMDAEGTNQVIRAQVPLAEMLSYQAQLKSMTGGRGDFAMELDHYDQVPAQVQEKIVADSKKEDHDAEEG